VIKCINGQTINFSQNSNHVESLSTNTTTVTSYDTYDSTNDNNVERTNNTLINSKYNMTSDDSPAFLNILTNETLIKSEYVTLANTEAYTIPDLKTCDFDKSNGIIVQDRTSSMFIGFITYNCSSINSSELFVFVNESNVENCIVTADISDNMNYTIVSITCDNIMNNAGRNWTFSIGKKISDVQIIFNEIFIVTLAPLSLNASTYINVTIVEDLEDALIFIPNCTDICDIE
ncbi:unnamed protein product, partial [Rotaria sp. Silwood1]